MSNFFSKLFFRQSLKKPQKQSVSDFGFQNIDTDSYSVSVDGDNINLVLKNSNVFIASDAKNSPFGSPQYTDLMLEADIVFDNASKNQAGFLLKKIDDKSFYSVLVSSDGKIRLDVFTNGISRTLVPWITYSENEVSNSVKLTIIMRGILIFVCVNEQFVLEAEDDSLNSGALAFTAQNTDKPALLSIKNFTLNVEPLIIETYYTRCSQPSTLTINQRRRLTEGLFQTAYYIPALVQLAKIYASETPTAQDRFLEAECNAGLKLYKEAYQAIESCLMLAPTMDEAIEEKYNLLYLLGEYVELKNALLKDQDKLARSPRLQNLLGHAWYNIADWDNAVKAYGEAVKLEPSMPIYLKNLAAALEKQNTDLNAICTAWFKAALGFYKVQAWDDLDDCSRVLHELNYDIDMLNSIDGLAAFGRGNYFEAERLLSIPYKKGVSVDAVAYIYGLLISKRNLSDATIAYKKAADLEPDNSLYLFRLAEAKFMLGDNCDDVLASALSIDPNDGWINNLAGQVAFSKKNYDKAEDFFNKALLAMPKEIIVRINLSQIYLLAHKYDQAVNILEDYPNNSASAANMLGNILVDKNMLEDAVAAYKKACTLAGTEPEIHEYRVNLAATLFELGQLAEAEDYLRPELYDDSNVRALTLMGDIASMHGNFARAEAAYITAMDREPDNAALLSHFTKHYIMRQRYEEALALVDRVATIDAAMATSLKQLVNNARFDFLHCSICGHEWNVPKKLPIISRTSINAMPPDDSPAGACPKCEKIYCVSCLKKMIKDNRFSCPSCNCNLTLNDDRIRWLVMEHIKK